MTITAAHMFVCIAMLAACTNEGAPEASSSPTDPMAGYYVVDRPTRTLNDPPRDLLPGFGFEITQVRKASGGKIAISRLGQVIRFSDLKRAQPSAFAGVHNPDPRLRLAFVVRQRADIREAPSPTAAVVTRAPRHAVLTLKTHDGPAGYYATTAGWVAAEDVRVPQLAAPPAGAAQAAVWINVDLRTQTLVAYVGSKPVFTTLISAGVGAPGSAFATPVGLHHIIAKQRAATMDNLEHTNVVPYHYETVPHTQFIGRVALHGVFWHDDFGYAKSHGCINLSLADAAFLFELTQPRVAVERNEARGESGTTVQVR